MASEYGRGEHLEAATPSLTRSVTFWHDDDHELTSSTAGYHDFQTSVRSQFRLLLDNRDLYLPNSS